MFNGKHGDVRNAEYFVGFKAKSTQITVEEAGEAQIYQVQPTIPFKCTFLLSQLNLKPNAIKCTKKLQIVVPSINDGPASCQQGDISRNIVFQTATTLIEGVTTPQDCIVTVEFFPFHENFAIEPVNITVNAVQDIIYDDTKEFALQMRVADNTAYWRALGLPELWSLVELPRVQVYL